MESLYSSDQPVEKAEQDLFQRFEFSKRIAHTIINRNDDDCLVIGLYGEWGEGKSSVLNFVETELKYSKDIKCVRFNPWRGKSEDDLLITLYLKICEVLDKDLYNIFENIAKKVESFGFVGGDYNFSGFAKHLSSVEIEKLKDRVNNYLIHPYTRLDEFEAQRKLSLKLVVFIDDIDRLDKDEIFSVMKLVKLNADFVKTTYILAFDDKMVASAIRERFSNSIIEAGHNFIEKIVQVPLRLSQVRRSDLRKFCLEKISNSLLCNKVELVEDEAKRFERIFEEGVFPSLHTPRLAVRYANSLSFILAILRDDVNTVDFMLLEAMKLFFPECYNLVRNSPEYFIDKGFIKTMIDNKSFSFRDKIYDLYPNRDEKEKEASLLLLIALFPRLDNFFERNNGFGPATLREWYIQKRIASEDYFNRYFTYALNERQISDLTITELINIAHIKEIEELVDYVKRMIDLYSTDEFLTKISNIHEKLEWNVIAKIIISMIKIPEHFGAEVSEMNFEDSSLRNRVSVFIFNMLLSHGSKAEKFDLAKKMMIEAESFNLAYDINHELRRKFRNEEQFFYVDQYLELGKILRNRAISEAGSMPIFQYIQKISQIQYLFDNWKSLNPSGLQAYVSKFVNEDPENVKYLIMAFTPEASIFGVDGVKKANFDQGYYLFLANMIDVKEIYNLIMGHFYSKISNEEIVYIDVFGDDKIQTYNNVLRQFVKCYEKDQRDINDKNI